MTAARHRPVRRGALVVGAALVVALLPAAAVTAAASPAAAVRAVPASTPTPLLPSVEPLPADDLAPGGEQPRSPSVRPDDGGPGAPTRTVPAPGAPTRSPAPSAPTRSVPGTTGAALGALALALLWAATIAWRTRSRLQAWTSPQRLAQAALVPVGGAHGADDVIGPGEPRAPAAAGAARPRVDVVLLARHASDELDRTLGPLTASRGVDLHVVVVVGQDDPGTLAVARGLATGGRAAAGARVDVVRHRGRWSERAAVGTGLRRCRGELLAVLEPGDVVHPDLLVTAAGHLASTGGDVLHTGVQRLPLRGRWWEWLDGLDDHFRCRSVLPGAARRGFAPVAGAGVVYRRSVLAEHHGRVGGLGEIGLVTVLQARGAQVDARYDARLTTRRPAARSLGDVLRRRTRESQELLQVLRAGDWRDLPTRRTRTLAVRALAEPVVPVLGALLGVATVVVALAASAPAVLLVPLAAGLVAAVVDAVALSQLGRDHGARVGPRDQGVALLGAAPFRLVTTLAALRGIGREATGRRDSLVDLRGTGDPAAEEPHIDLRDHVTAPAERAQGLRR